MIRFFAAVRQNPLARLALLIIAIVIAAAALAPYLAPYDYAEQDLRQIARPPSPRHPLGTDGVGRDVLSRLLHGARVSLSVALVVSGIELGCGLVIGIAAGLSRGRLDTLLMRVTDAMFAFPDILLAILVTSLLGPSLWTVFLALGLVGWPSMVRLVRAQVLTLREREFVAAARLAGAGPWRLTTRHLIPNLLGPVVVALTVGVGWVVLAEATLSFLGLGLQPPVPSWGSMISDAWQFHRVAPLMTLWPALALALTVFSFNFIGDALRDALDPTQEARR